MFLFFICKQTTWCKRFLMNLTRRSKRPPRRNRRLLFNSSVYEYIINVFHEFLSLTHDMSIQGEWVCPISEAKQTKPPEIDTMTEVAMSLQPRQKSRENCFLAQTSDITAQAAPVGYSCHRPRPHVTRRIKQGDAIVLPTLWCSVRHAELENAFVRPPVFRNIPEHSALFFPVISALPSARLVAAREKRDINIGTASSKFWRIHPPIRTLSPPLSRIWPPDGVRVTALTNQKLPAITMGAWNSICGVSRRSRRYWASRKKVR